DLTSLPASASPASTRSSRWYSCRARRFSAISFSPWGFAMRSIVGAAGCDTFGALPFHTRRDFVATLIAGGGWTEIPTRVGTRAHEPSYAPAGRPRPCLRCDG